MKIQKREMKNGLVVASEAMPHLRSVSLGVWVKGGSRFEQAGQCGIAHYIEHMLFKGTGSRSAAEIARSIDSVGGQLDAFTDKECVGFYARVLDRYLPLAFELLSDIVQNPTFPPAEIKRERNVIFEEISTIEDSPQELVHDLYLNSLWPEHPLGRPVSGTKESIAAITRKDLRAYFRHNYSACNIVVSAAGNLRHREVQSLAERHFAGLPAGSPVVDGAPPVAKSARAIRRKPNLEQVYVCLGVPCPPLLSEDRYCAHLMSNILGGSISSRLFQNIREKRGLVYSIDSSLSLFRDAGTLVVSAAASSRTAFPVVGLVLKEFRQLREKLVSSDELKRAKEYIKGSMMLGMESSSSRMTQLAQQQIDFGRFFTLDEIARKLDRVRAADIRRLANEIFDSSSLALAALGSADGRVLESLKAGI